MIDSFYITYLLSVFFLHTFILEVRFYCVSVSVLCFGDMPLDLAPAPHQPCCWLWTVRVGVCPWLSSFRPQTQGCIVLGLTQWKKETGEHNFVLNRRGLGP